MTPLNDGPITWQRKGKKIVYSNPWVEMEEHQVVDPSGNDTIYGVLHARHVAVGILPLDEENNTWLVGQYRFPIDQYSWEIIEGGGALDVDPVTSAKRELKEEAGIMATGYTEIMRMYTCKSMVDELAILYVARGLSFGETDRDDSEDLRLQKLPFEEAYQYVMNGRITDSMSIAAILKTKLLMDAGEL